MITARDNVAARKITNVKARDVGGMLRQCQFARVRNADGTLRTVWAFLTASAAPATVDGYANSPAAIGITTASATAAASGGTAPYTYAWTRTDSDPAAWSINTPTAATASFRATSVIAGDSQTATFVCTVTDANGVTATTVAITATATNTNTS